MPFLPVRNDAQCGAPPEKGCKSCQPDLELFTLPCKAAARFGAQGTDFRFIRLKDASPPRLATLGPAGGGEMA
jgi:hypothetical protein